MRILVLAITVLGWSAGNNLGVLADEKAAALVSSNSVWTKQDTNHVSVSFKLKPTAVAPIRADGVGALTAGSVTLHLSNLGPGRYELQAVRRSDGVSQKLGTINIIDPTLSPDRQANDNKKEASASPDEVRLDADVQITLSKGISPGQIGRLVLVDAVGNTVLWADTE